MGHFLIGMWAIFRSGWGDPAMQLFTGCLCLRQLPETPVAIMAIVDVEISMCSSDIVLALTLVCCVLMGVLPW